MRVKRYVVDSMPDALEKIRIDLGKDAIILNSKPIRTGGLFGLFGKQRIEVVAAVDDKGAERAPSALPPASRTFLPGRRQAATPLSRPIKKRRWRLLRSRPQKQSRTAPVPGRRLKRRPPPLPRRILVPIDRRQREPLPRQRQ